jgi:hypothetical protein
MLAIGYWLLAIGYWLLAIGYWLFDRRTIPRSIKTGHRGTRMSQITADSQ